MQRVWTVRQSDSKAIELLARDLDIPVLIAKLLLQRGVTTPEQGHKFLFPSLSELHDPVVMKGMEQAVSRLVTAISSREPVCIFGDYDVDGVTSVALIWLFLRQVGLECEFYIPSRIEEGYGLNEESVNEMAARGTRLLITVDCGISDMRPIQRAVEAGMEVMVIDHHQVPDRLPPAAAILNPQQSDCAFPTKDLAAVGVVFNLVMALRAGLRSQGWFAGDAQPNLREFLDLVALGTIADMVPLVDENRVVARFGLEELSAGRRPGVAALKEVTGILSGKVTVGHVGFRLAPRINAAGRLGNAGQAVELLTTDSYSRALHLARQLDRANSERQTIEQEIFKDALEMARTALEQEACPALVLASEGWHVGVVGIVASRLVERFACPVVLIALDGDQGRGSARSTEDVHLYQAICACAEDLEAYGGHRAAAGLRLRKEKLEGFRRAFFQAVMQQRAGLPPARTMLVDGEIGPAAWDTKLVEMLQLLGPHGLGNPEPRFVARDLEVRSVRTVGREMPKHIKAVVSDGRRTWDAIGFGMGDRVGEIRRRVDLLYTPEFNTWEGATSIQLRLRDLRPSIG